MNMIERVDAAITKAEEIAGGRFYVFDYSSYPGDKPPHVVREDGRAIFRTDNPESAQAVYRAAVRHFIARAAIEAMREPSEEMVDEGESNIEERCEGPVWYDRGGTNPLYDAYQVMIDVALNST